MKHEDHDQMTDRLLGAALARYSDVEPRNGLEQRILANLATHSAQRTPIWNRLLWASAACAAALAMVAGISLLHSTWRPTSSPTTNIKTPAYVQPQPSLVIANTAETRKPSRIPAVRASATKASSPRLSQFPAPAPPTEQELLLMAYLNATPTEELLAVAADQQRWRERVKDGAPPAEGTAKTEIRDLRNSPPESGTRETSASSARQEKP